MQDHSKADEAFLLTSSYLLDLASRAHELLMSSQPAQKNALLKFVLANCKADGEKLYLQLKSTFEGIVFANKSNQWLPLLDSLRTNLMSEVMRMGEELKFMRLGCFSTDGCH